MGFFDLCILLLSLIVRKKCTKKKYVFFLVLFVIMISINVMGIYQAFGGYQNTLKYLSASEQENMRKGYDIIKVFYPIGLVIDIIGICLLRKWHARYLISTMGEEQYLKMKKEKHKKEHRITKPFIVFMVIALIVMVVTMISEIADGKSWLSHESAQSMLVLLVTALIVMWIVSRKKDSMKLKAAMAWVLMLAVMFGGITLSGVLSKPISDFAKGQAMARFESEAKQNVQNSIKEQLKAPDSAKFGEYKIVQNDGEWMIYGTVQAPNSFGVMVESEYTATYNPNTGEVTSTWIEP